MLTSKQHELLSFIHQRLGECGISPSFDEMREALDLKSKSGVHRLISALEERQFIRRLPNRARALEVLKMPELAISPAKSVQSVAPAPLRIAANDTIEIPLHGRIAAGTPIEALQGTEGFAVPAALLRLASPKATMALAVLLFGGAIITALALPAEVVLFDPDADLAVLSVPTFTAPPLTMAEPKVGTSGAVYGHPHGGPLQVIPARIAQNIVAVGTDIYRTSSSRRHVLVLATSLQPGDSGGALVDRSGNVVGVAFATDPGQAHTGYALTSDEVRAVLAAAGSQPVATGSCLVE